MNVFFVLFCFFNRNQILTSLFFNRKEEDTLPLSILSVSLQLIHERPEDQCWFFLGLVLFQHLVRQLAGQLFCFGPLACE